MVILVINFQRRSKGLISAALSTIAHRHRIYDRTWTTSYIVTRSHVRIYFLHTFFQSKIVIGLVSRYGISGNSSLPLSLPTSNKIWNSLLSSYFFFNVFKKYICWLKTNTSHHFLYVNVFYMISHFSLVSRDRTAASVIFFIVFHQSVV